MCVPGTTKSNPSWERWDSPRRFLGNDSGFRVQVQVFRGLGKFRVEGSGIVFQNLVLKMQSLLL